MNEIKGLRALVVREHNKARDAAGEKVTKKTRWADLPGRNKPARASGKDAASWAIIASARGVVSDDTTLELMKLWCK